MELAHRVQKGSVVLIALGAVTLIAIPTTTTLATEYQSYGSIGFIKSNETEAPNNPAVFYTPPNTDGIDVPDELPDAGGNSGGQHTGGTTGELPSSGRSNSNTNVSTINETTNTELPQSGLQNELQFAAMILGGLVLLGAYGLGKQVWRAPTNQD
ncbi:hypothetical protein EQG49_07840 [Periweissella cryptocerci]|uniref:LPXTG cell wall anchor domain-containing protein n=1 Tax=Periweissella cryptocerci TaxID=2506420 RepID=A0A4P6YUG0_9LACO|nr:hypothetical protein [Periweissella cryptocerci]QBO36380.1 hypothetical protein EQG49_07840 [Periweissella cryptocerci]